MMFLLSNPKPKNERVNITFCEKLEGNPSETLEMLQRMGIRLCPKHNCLFLTPPERMWKMTLATDDQKQSPTQNYWTVNNLFTKDC
jgi:hypothetical protein